MGYEIETLKAKQEALSWSWSWTSNLSEGIENGELSDSLADLVHYQDMDEKFAKRIQKEAEKEANRISLRMITLRKRIKQMELNESTYNMIHNK